MKRIISFNKAFLPTAVGSAVLMALGIIGYIVLGGFNLGVDFQAGLIQEVQFAPTAFELRYSGNGVASVVADSSSLSIVVSGAEVENKTYAFTFTEYPTIGALVTALASVPDLSVDAKGAADAPASTLMQSAQEQPRLGSEPYSLHYLVAGTEPIALDKVRTAVSSIPGVSVQVLGNQAERKFMVRVEDQGKESGFAKTATENIAASLSGAFGTDNVVINRTDYVGARFSRNLSDQAAVLLLMTLVVILVYSSVRFHLRYALGAVLAIVHDALIMTAFIVWTRMEFNTTSIAAILTVLGYSINDTIVIFDRIREDVRLYPDEAFGTVVNRAVTETLGRTFITTLTTLLAVLSLFIFTTGSMQDFALALIVGMISGTYSTIFIATSFVVWWDKQAKKRAARLPKAAAAAKA